MIKTSDFKIKTKVMKRPNGATKNYWPCGIDIGYSSVKLFTPNRVAIFPSFAIAIDAQEIGEPSPDYIRYKNLDTGKTWLVGKAAENTISQRDLKYNDTNLYGRDRYESEMFEVLINTALGFALEPNEYGSIGYKRLFIQTGLPSEYIQEDSELLKNSFVGNHHFSLKVGNSQEKEYNITIGENQVDVMEQPMGTLMSVIMGENHLFIPDAMDYLNKNVIVFDGGHGTLDLFLIKNNVVYEKITYRDFSMYKILSNVRDRIFEEFKQKISPIAMQKCLEDGTFYKHDKYSSKSIPFDYILSEENSKICNEAIERIASDYELYDFDYFIVTGGTGAAWYDVIKDKLKDLEGFKIVPGNQNDPSLPFDFANSRGYYMYLYSKLKRAEKEDKGIVGKNTRWFLWKLNLNYIKLSTLTLFLYMTTE